MANKKDEHLAQKIDVATAKTIKDVAKTIRMEEGWVIYVAFASSSRTLEKIQLFYNKKDKIKAKEYFDKLLADWVEKELMILEYPEGETIEAIPSRAVISITFAKSRGFFTRDAVGKVAMDNLIRNIRDATEVTIAKRVDKKMEMLK